MSQNLMMTEERMIEELTRFRNPNLTQEEAKKVVTEMMQDLSFWMDIEKKFHDKATEILDSFVWNRNINKWQDGRNR